MELYELYKSNNIQVLNNYQAMHINKDKIKHLNNSKYWIASYEYDKSDPKKRVFRDLKPTLVTICIDCNSYMYFIDNRNKKIKLTANTGDLKPVKFFNVESEAKGYYNNAIAEHVVDFEKSLQIYQDMLKKIENKKI